MAKKDLSTIWARTDIRTILMLPPLLLAVGVPILFSVVVGMLGAENTTPVPQAILALLPEAHFPMGPVQAWLDAFTTLLCPQLFLAVPVLCGTASAACIFVAEREDGTLETLFLSSMETKSVFRIKVTVCVLLTVFISLIAFVAFAITVTVADLLHGAPYFLSLEWLIRLVFLMPLFTLCSVSFISLIIPRVHSVGEALQTMGYLLLPLILVTLMRLAGVLRFGMLPQLVLVVLLAVLSVVLYNVSARSFQAEKLL